MAIQVIGNKKRKSVFSPWDIWLGDNAYLSHYLAAYYIKFMDERFKYYRKYNENIWRLMSRIKRFKI